MATSDSTPLECGICGEIFDEKERSPRFLTCGHSLCTSCIVQLLHSTHNMTCPFCRQHFKGTTVEEFGINWTLLDVLQNDKERKDSAPNGDSLMQWLEEIKERIAVNPMKQTRKIKEDFSKAASTTRGIAELVSKTNEIKIRLQNFLSNNEFLVPESRELSRAHEKLESKYVDLMDIEKEIKKMDDTIKPAKSFTEAAPLLDQISKMEKNVKRRIFEIKDYLKGYRHESIRIERTVRVTCNQLSNIMDSLSGNTLVTIGGAGDIAPISRRWEDDPDYTITPADVKRMTPYVKRLAEERRIRTYKDIPFYGRLRGIGIVSYCENGQICLHHLKFVNQSYPLDAHFFKHEDLIGSFDPLVTFMDFTSDGRPLGRLLIGLNLEGNLPINFRLLCSGQMGKSYAQGRQYVRLRSSNFHGFVELKMWGAPVINGVNWLEERKREIYSRSAELGSVYAVPWVTGEVSMFRISVKPSQSTTDVRCFGKVIEGLEILQEAVRRNYVEKLVISDCGIIVP